MITALRLAMNGTPRRLPAALISRSWTFGSGGSWNLPSGALRIPSTVPVTPMYDSARSYQGAISSYAMGQSQPIPSREYGLKSMSEKRKDMRP